MTSLSEQIEYIKLHCSHAPEPDIHNMYTLIHDSLIEKKTTAFLSILNKILVSIKRPEIKNLTELSFIEKNNLVSKSTEKIVDENIDILFGPFCKNSYNFYMRTNYKHFFLVFLRKACVEINYSLISYKKKNITCVSFIKNN